MPHPFRMTVVAACFLAVAVVASAEQAPTPRAVGLTAEPAGSDLDRKILAEAKERSQIMSNLGYISDTIGHRLTGSPSLERANRWTAEKMKEYGLENVRLEPWEIPIGWERGTATMKIVEPENGRSLLVAAGGWTPGTNGKVTGPVVIMQAKSKADLEKYKGKLKNAVILRSPPTPVAPIGEIPTPKKDFAPKTDEPKKAEAKSVTAAVDEPKKFETKKDEPKKDEPKKDEPKKDAPPSATQPARPNMADFGAFRREMDDFLKAEGAAAVLSDSGKPHGLLVTTGGWREGDRATPQDPIARLFIAHEHYALLYRLASAKTEKPVMVEVEVTNKFIPGPITVYNTIGEIVGSEKPDEIIVVGAHLDSWDLATGTTDNGTGSCVILETARILATLAKAGHRPKRTIRFCLFTGEEQGLYGSKRYVEKHKDEMPKHSAAIVHDTGTGMVTGFGVLGRESVQKLLEPELAILKTVDGWKGLTLGGIRGGTDHWSFDQVGVPGFACNQDSDEYRLTHHTQTDTFDKAKEPFLIQGASVMAVTASRIANLPDLLPRDKPTGGGGFGPKKDRGNPDAKKPEEKKPEEKKP